MRTLASSPIGSVKWAAEQPPENNATQQAEAHSTANTKHPAAGRLCKKSSMRVGTNSSLWLMGDVTVVTVTLSLLCTQS